MTQSDTNYENWYEADQGAFRKLLELPAEEEQQELELLNQNMAKHNNVNGYK